MMAETKKLSWNPKRYGDKFCAPACGRGCTVDEHSRAWESATALADELGTGWHEKVHENLGWYYKVVSACGRIEVTSFGSDSFTAFLSEAHQGGGRWTGRGTTPQEAVNEALAAAREELAVITKILDGLQMAL